MTTAQELFTEEQTRLIMQAVKDAERKTSGEIRVHIEKTTSGIDVLDRAANVFSQLDLHRTRLRNGVLFYLAAEDRKFAILGDIGINNAVSDDFWDDIRKNMELFFRQGNFTEGMIHGIKMAGSKLLEKFPYLKDDINELPDEISFG
jgi:uncharacterized membrane protein